MADKLQKVIDSCDFLKELAATGEALTFVEICKLVNKPAATTSRMLESLLSVGFIDKTGDRYSIGFELCKIWSKYRNQRIKDRAIIDKELAETADLSKQGQIVDAEFHIH